jgi:uncharacterized protein (TIGR00299 family) protein
MTIAYFDTFCGISGDMTLGALLDLGLSVDALRQALEKLPVHGWRLDAEPVLQHGISATRAKVSADHDHHGDHHHGRSLRVILDLIEASELSGTVKERSARVFRTVGEAEARVHGTTPEEIHFHELGGLDSIVDIVGVVAGLELLGVERVYASPLPLSHGWVSCAHGLLPVPAPAVVELLQSVPTVPLDLEGETVTPTGAALLVALAQSFGGPPPMTLTKVGYGAGTRQWPHHPNLLRVMLGQADDLADVPQDRVILLEANLDDLNPELLPDAMEHCFTAGAVDVWYTPIMMKKGRPATQVSVLAPPDRVDAVAEALFRHTSTLGVRRSEWSRHCLQREQRTVETPFGPIRVKVGKLNGEEITRSPEHDDCARAAKEHGVSVREVYDAAARTAADSSF